MHQIVLDGKMKRKTIKINTLKKKNSPCLYPFFYSLLKKIKLSFVSLYSPFFSFCVFSPSLLLFCIVIKKAQKGCIKMKTTKLLFDFH
jgi:hypothetical protein